MCLLQKSGAFGSYLARSFDERMQASTTARLGDMPNAVAVPPGVALVSGSANRGPQPENGPWDPRWEAT